MARLVISSTLVIWSAVPAAQAQSAAPEPRASLETIRRGQSIWQNKRCAACHAIGQPHSGPDLAGVQERRSREWLYRWMKDSEGMIRRGDSISIALMREYNNLPMPSFKLSEKDTDALLAFFAAEEARVLRSEERARQRARP